MDKVCKSQIVQYLAAFIISILIMNLLVAVYYRPVGAIGRTGGATEGIWNPNKIIVHGNEGYGIYKVDAKGYLNASIPDVRGGMLLR